MEFKKTKAKEGCSKKVKRAARLLTIEPSLLIHMTATFVGNLVASNLLLYKACAVDLGHNATFCEDLVAKPRGGPTNSAEEEVQEHVSSVRTWTTLVDDLFPILYVLFLGAWSDTYGRKMPYIITMFGYVVRYGMLLLVTYFSNWNTAVTAVITSLPVSLTGSRVALSLTMYSYVSDTTSMADRTLKMAMAGGFRALGKSTGSLIGGELVAAEWGYYAIFCFGAALELVAIVVAWISLTDKRDEEKMKGKTSWQAFKDVFDLHHIKDAGVAFFRKRPNGDRTRLFLLVVAVTCTTVPMVEEEGIIYRFTRLQLGWNAETFGTYNAYKMAMGFIGGLASVAILSSWLKVADAIIGILAAFSEIGANLVYCFAESDWMMYLAPLVEVLGSTTRSMISKIIPRHETGKVNSFIGLVDVLIPLASGPAYNALYTATLDYLPGAFFLLSTGITVPALIIFIILAFFWKKEDRDPNLPILPKNGETIHKSSSTAESDLNSLSS